MSFPAFVACPYPVLRTYLRKRNTLVSSKPRRSRIYGQKRRIRITSKNLYPEVDPPEVDPPEVDPPEPISNPLEQNKQPRKPDDSEEPFLKRLNDRTSQKRVTDTSATTLEPLQSEVEAESAISDSNVSRVADFSSAPLSPETTEEKTSTYAAAARALWRLGWFSWWIQLILSVISGVILLFSFAFPGVNVRNSASALGFVLSGVGVLVAFISLFWTYSYTRLSLWLEGGKGTAEQARQRINGRLRFGFLFSIAGLLVSLVGLQAIVGTLLARLFGAGIATTPYTAYQTGSIGVPGGPVQEMRIVQPVDILVVQACANSMMALLAALMTTSWFQSRQKTWNKEAKVQ